VIAEQHGGHGRSAERRGQQRAHPQLNAQREEQPERQQQQRARVLDHHRQRRARADQGRAPGRRLRRRLQDRHEQREQHHGGQLMPVGQAGVSRGRAAERIGEHQQRGQAPGPQASAQHREQQHQEQHRG